MEGSGMAGGAQPPMQQPVQPLMQQPMQAPMAGPPRKGYVTLITMGIIILLIGCIIAASVGFLKEPNQDDYDWPDEAEDYADDVEAYEDAQRTIPTIGVIIRYVGVILFALGIISGGISDKELHPNVRLGMFIALGIIVGYAAAGTFFII